VPVRHESLKGNISGYEPKLNPKDEEEKEEEEEEEKNKPACHI